MAWDESFQDYPGVLLANRNLFESLHDAGYHTVGIASHYYFNTPGLTQGFDEFDNSDAPTSDDAGGKDVHYGAAPGGARSSGCCQKLAADRLGRSRCSCTSSSRTPPTCAIPEVRGGRPAPSTREEQYDEEVRYLDGQLQRRLFDRAGAAAPRSEHR